MPCNKTGYYKPIIQFMHNKRPYASFEEALEAVETKNLLPGEPALVYYTTEDHAISSFLAIGQSNRSDDVLVLKDLSDIPTPETIEVVDELGDSSTKAISQNAATTELETKALKCKAYPTYNDIEAAILESNATMDNGALLFDEENGDFYVFNKQDTSLVPINGGALKEIEDIEERPGLFIVDRDFNIGLKYDEDGLDAAKLSEHFKSLLPQPSAQNTFVGPKKLTVCSYNVCEWAWVGAFMEESEIDLTNPPVGRETITSLDSSTYLEQRQRVRQIINDINADVLCLQETRGDVGGIELSPEFIGEEMAPQYKSGSIMHNRVSGSGYSTGIFANLDTSIGRPTGINGFDGKTSSEYGFTEVRGELYGVPVVFVSVHLNWNVESNIKTYIQHFAEKYANEEHVVLCGDWNVYSKAGGGEVIGSDEDNVNYIMDKYSPMIGAGFTPANWGYLGRIKTCVNNTKCSNAGDNIFVKGFNILSTKVIKSYVSDHWPLVCELEII